MSILDTLKSGYDMISGGNKSPGAPKEGGVMNKLMGLVGGGKNPEIAKEAHEGKSMFESLRSGLFGEVAKSAMLRQFPRLTQVTDVGQFLSGDKAIMGNFIEFLTSMSLFIPASWLQHFTDIFASTTVFQTLVKHWPGLDGLDIPLVGPHGAMSHDIPVLGEFVGKGGSLRDLILNRQPPDPKAVIQAIRIMHQDLVTGKTTYDSLSSSIGSGGALAAVVGGGGALALGANLLGGGDSGGAGNLLDKAKNAVGLGGATGGGAKIVDLISHNPSAEKTKMQKNLVDLLDQLGVKEKTTLKKGKWEGNNDEVTVEFEYNGGIYYLIFDDDLTGTDIKVNNSTGVEIANFIDYGGFDADDTAKDIIKAIHKNPSPAKPEAPKPVAPIPPKS